MFEKSPFSLKLPEKKLPDGPRFPYKIEKPDMDRLPEKLEGPEEHDYYPQDIGTIPEDLEAALEKELNDYFEDLKAKSECPETISDEPFSVFDLEKVSPEELAKAREEFARTKADLKRQWEEKNGRPWPKYETDVYSESGKLIRRAGSDYDAHHIQPLCMGGRNDVDNITPLHAEVHYDKQGVHAPDSPYSRLGQKLGGMDND